MQDSQERPLVYTALLIACAVIGLGAGPAVGAWSFLQVAIMIELAYWLGTRRGVGHDKRRHLGGE
ncbi:MAG: hypothetical protein AAGA91_08260 [Pseudomonadota bacterium]